MKTGINVGKKKMAVGRWGVIDLTYVDGILRISPTDDMIYELDDLIQFHKYVLSMTKGDRFLVLSDYREHHLDIDRDTLKYAAKNEWLHETRIAEAVLLKSLPNLLISRFYIRTLKPLTPTKIFRNENTALRWLEMWKDYGSLNKKV
jgi:hypothetical protein